MGTAAAPLPATPKQIAAWKQRTGHTIDSAAVLLGVHPRTFCRWMSGETESPKWLGERFRTGNK